jgi:hypothetical protein
MTYER